MDIRNICSTILIKIEVSPSKSLPKVKQYLLHAEAIKRIKPINA